MASKRAIINGRYYDQADQDELDKQKRFADNADFHREADREDNYIDIIQPWIGNKPNKEFIKAYPQYAKNYFTEEELKYE